MANKRIQLGSVDLSEVENKHCWYPVVTLYNHEENFARNLKDAITDSPLESLVSEIYVPVKISKEMVKLKDGSSKAKNHRQLGAYSGYVFVRCILTEALWNLLRNTTGVAVVLSTGGIPSPITSTEIKKIKKQQKPEGFSQSELKKMAEEYKRKYIVTELKEDSIAEELLNVDEKIENAIKNKKILCTSDKNVCQKLLNKLSRKAELFGFSAEESCESVWNLFKHNTAFSFEDGKLYLANKETYKDEKKIILNELDFVEVVE